MKIKSSNNSGGFNRRDFLKSTTAAGLATLLSVSPRVYAAGSDKIRIGQIGCGSRGRHDMKNCLNSADNVELVAMGDLFSDQLDSAIAELSAELPDKIKVMPEARFVGFDAYKKVLSCDIDMVVLTQIPHFRPAHFKAAVEAGKHVFMEKPVAVDPAGVRSVIETAAIADQKNLKVVAGTQMRRIAHLVAGVERIHNGQIGDIVEGHCIRHGEGLMNWGVKPRKDEWSDMEWQLRRWLFVTWLSGDFIAEQHIHNLDIINWALNSHPIQCFGSGGRQVRTGPEYGDVFDHFAVEYEYPNDVKIQYMGQQIDGCSDRNNQFLAGTKGNAYLDFANAVIKGQNPWRYQGEVPNPEIKQHADHIAAIREDKPLNEAKRVAESTLTAIMGRMSAYTGRALQWDWVMNASKLDLTPASYEFGKLPPLEVAMPGKTKLI
jgi:predicted dehydrogenase